MDYNQTVHLPQTDFPMRAGLPKREPEMLKRWQEQDVYNELLKKNGKYAQMWSSYTESINWKISTRKGGVIYE